MSYEQPDGCDMDIWNAINERNAEETELLRQCYAMINDKNYYGIPQYSHIKVLLKKIQDLETQINLGQVNNDLPY